MISAMSGAKSGSSPVLVNQAPSFLGPACGRTIPFKALGCCGSAEAQTTVQGHTD